MSERTRDTVAPPLTSAPLAADLPERLAAAAPRIVVLGDAVLDCWMSGPSRRLSREAPVPVVEVDRTHAAPGGAANTAVNLAAMGATVRLVSAVGDDDDGHTLRAAARAGRGRHRGRPRRRRGPDGGEAAHRRRRGHGRPLRHPPAAAPVAGFAAALDAALDTEPDAVVVCDYGTGALDELAVAALASRRARCGVLVVDAHDPARWAPVGARCRHPQRRRSGHPARPRPARPGPGGRRRGRGRRAARPVGRRHPSSSPSTATGRCCSPTACPRTAPGRARCPRAARAGRATPSPPR